MKILHVSRLRAEETRFGLGRAVHQLMHGQRRQGLDVQHFCADDLGAPEHVHADQMAVDMASQHGDVLAPLYPVLATAWHTGFAASRRAVAAGASHVHCHDSVVAHGFMQGLGRRTVRVGTTQHGFNSIAVSLHQHVMPLPPGAFDWLTAVERQVLKACDWTIPLSEASAERLALELSLARPTQWQVIQHAKPDWQLPTRAQARAQLGWRADERVLLAVGQLVPLKRIDWVLRAMPSAPQPWRLLVLGQGDAQALLDLAGQIGAAAPEIRFVEDPRLHFAAADAFASASATESFGMAHLEALLAGLPIACTAVGGVPELTGDAALLLPDDREAFISGLQSLLHQGDLQQDLAARARQRAAQWPGIDAVARQHLQLYQRSPHPLGEHFQLRPFIDAGKPDSSGGA